MRISNRYPHKRAQNDAIPSLSGALTVAVGSSATTGPLILNPTNTASISVAPLTTFSEAASPSTTPSSTSSTVPPSTSPTSSAALSSDSSIPVGTVVGACVGAFVGLALLLYLCYLYSKRHLGGGAAREGNRGRDENWKKLDENQDKWAGMPTSPNSSREMEEKNRALFKKSPSMHTTRTKLSDDDHGYGIPPFEFSKYHPNLAEELSLEKPARPFAGAAAQRSDSGVSWDGSTVHDDSFLSMRSVRVDSGTMSPTLVMAKMTSAALSNPVHKWESAEVLTMEEEDVTGPKEVHNPFVDVNEQRRSVANPFFNAQELQRSGTRRNRSRSNSRSGRARSVSDTISRTASIATYRQSERISNPFTDIQEVPVYHVSPPGLRDHTHNDSVASGSSASMFGQHAMKSLIAALDLTQEEVEERLRVVSMQDSNMSRFSTISGAETEADIATVRQFPMPPP